MLEVQLSEQLTVDRRLWSVDKIGQQSMVDSKFRLREGSAVDSGLSSVDKNLQISTPHKNQKQQAKSNSIPAKGRKSMSRYVGQKQLYRGPS